MCPWGSNIDGRSFTFKSRWIHCRAGCNKQSFAVTGMEVLGLINHEFNKRWRAAGEIRLLLSKRFLGSDFIFVVLQQFTCTTFLALKEGRGSVTSFFVSVFLFLAYRDCRVRINSAVHFSSFIFLSSPILYLKDKLRSHREMQGIPCRWYCRQGYLAASSFQSDVSAPVVPWAFWPFGSFWRCTLRSLLSGAEF